MFGGFLLRLFFVRRHAFLAGDSILYQDIAQNWLHEHVYGLSTDTAPRPTLIRVPGYPAILATLAWAFDRFLQADPGTLRSFLPVFWVQIAADLGTCWLAAAIAFHMYGRRAALAALALGCVCPFTANYVAVPLTETFTLFFLCLTFYLLQRWIAKPSHTHAAAVALALACSILLRPDQGLLTLPVLLVFFRLPGGWRKGLSSAMLCMVLTAVPFVPWTIRNLHTFQVLQPLASRLAIDPGEQAPTGFQYWFRTWGLDFSSTQDAYWKYPEETVLVADLPLRAFDSVAERAAATALLAAAGNSHLLEPSIEEGFAALAARRARKHPLRTHVLLPSGRLLNMLLHPRTEMLPIAERWWQYRAHPGQSLFAWSYAALNFFYLAVAAAGFVLLRRSPWQSRLLATSMAAYLLLRCALLMTLDNAEQRYTLEFFPVLFVFAAALWQQKAAAEG